MTPEQIAAVAGKLTKAECFLLGWLAKEEFSSPGECKGSSLNKLVSLGLAAIGSVPFGRHLDYAGVCVLPDGLAVRAHLEKEARL